GVGGAVGVGVGEGEEDQWAPAWAVASVAGLPRGPRVVLDQVKAQQHSPREGQGMPGPGPGGPAEEGLGVPQGGPGGAALPRQQALDAALGVLDDEDAGLAAESRVPPGEGDFEREGLVGGALQLVEGAQEDTVLQLFDKGAEGTGAAAAGLRGARKVRG